VSSDHPLRQDLVQDARFLIQSLKDMVLQSSLPFPRAETLGLAALIYLALARQPARGDGDEHILLEDQDRSLWDQQSIREGERLLDQALALRDPGPYQLQAAISALHCQSPSFEETDWTQICLLYQKLITVLPSPAAQLAYVVALANQGEISQAEQIHAQLAAAPLAQDLSYHMTEAFLYEKREKIKQAIEVYQRLLKEKRSPSQTADDPGQIVQAQALVARFPNPLSPIFSNDPRYYTNASFACTFFTP
jgi:RNA polymerase sigma-70 factor (ECF subfamily)